MLELNDCRMGTKEIDLAVVELKAREVEVHSIIESQLADHDGTRPQDSHHSLPLQPWRLSESTSGHEQSPEEIAA